MQTIIRLLALGASPSASMAMFGQDFTFRRLDVPGASAPVPTIREIIVGDYLDAYGNDHGLIARKHE